MGVPNDHQNVYIRARLLVKTLKDILYRQYINRSKKDEWCDGALASAVKIMQLKNSHRFYVYDNLLYERPNMHRCYLMTLRVAYLRFWLSI